MAKKFKVTTSMVQVYEDHETVESVMADARAEAVRIMAHTDMYLALDVVSVEEVKEEE